MRMSVGQVSKATGVSVRTLHYYDEIGILKPGETTLAGYRFYDENDLAVLQQIMFYRELDFSLEQIKEFLQNPKYEKNRALEHQKHLLTLKEHRLKELISLIDKTLKGESTMSFKEFDVSKIEEAKEKYSKEVKEKWGETKEFIESEVKTKNYGKEQWQKIDEGANKIFEWFANNKDKAVNDPEVMEMVKKWQEHISKNFYSCSNNVLSGLADMYIFDDRFKDNLDKFGKGTAQFIHDAIKEYCKKQGF